MKEPEMNLEILARSLVERCLSLHFTVATAESCTGGLIGKTLTDISGSSGFYLGGIISYSNDVKQNLLGVPRELLSNFGAVSGEVAEAMARGVLGGIDASCAVAVTGIAGPNGGTAEKPVGLVYISVALRDGRILTERNVFEGSRDEIREKTVHRALVLILSVIPKGEL